MASRKPGEEEEEEEEEDEEEEDEDEDEEEEESGEDEETRPDPKLLSGSVAARPGVDDDKEFDFPAAPAGQPVLRAAPRPSTAVRNDEAYARSLQLDEQSSEQARKLQEEEDLRLAAKLEMEASDAEFARRLEQEAKDEAYARSLNTEKVQNAPHDEVLVAQGEEDEEEEHVPTPPEPAQPAPPPPAPVPAQVAKRLEQEPAPAAVGYTAQRLHNAAHDEAIEARRDDEFEFDEDEESVPTPIVTPRETREAREMPAEASIKKLANHAYDEALEVDDDHHVASPRPAPAALGPAGAFGAVAVRNAAHDEAVDLDSDPESVSSDEEHQQTPQRPLDTAQYRTPPPAQQQLQQQQPMPQQRLQKQAAQQQHLAPDQESSSSEDEEDGATPTAARPAPAGGYNAAEFANLQVSREVKDLFLCIQRYTPHEVELESRLKPFIPDYIPAVGDIDTFVKVPRPDSRPDSLGLTVLDEPTSQPSNPAVVKLGLAYQTKSTHKPSEFVESIDDAGRRPALVDKWMSDIAALHRRKPAPTVNYTRPMPDVEQLLQVWPAEFEDLLTRGPALQPLSLPPAALRVELYQYVRVVCCLLDIPVYQNLIESLHVLFTLYSEFKANQHFQSHDA